MTNYLYYGDNLDVLHESIPNGSVDLVYLDPPFNSNRSYNVLFKNKSGEDAQAQIVAFDDTWTWSHEAEQQYVDLLSGGAPAKVADAIEAMRKLLGDNDVLAYLVMMTPRLVELHRVLKPTGSLYLHCDPTASHYLKVMLDAIFAVLDELSRANVAAYGLLELYGPGRDQRTAWPWLVCSPHADALSLGAGNDCPSGCVGHAQDGYVETSSARVDVSKNHMTGVLTA